MFYLRILLNLWFKWFYIINVLRKILKQVIFKLFYKDGVIVILKIYISFIEQKNNNIRKFN